MITQYIQKLASKEHLTSDEAFNSMNFILQGNASEAQIASFITALHMLGETEEEISGSAKAMIERATIIDGHTDACDIVGTGGDCLGSFNISTTSAFIASGAGVKIAKHGNSAVTSKSGSANVLEALGVNINISKEKAKEALDTIKLAFLYAKTYHKCMVNCAQVRSEIKIRTIFNILGPLANPCLAKNIVLGVAKKELLPIMIKAVDALSIKNAIIAHSADGLDEISISDKTYIFELKNGKVSEYEINPSDFGLKTYDISEILGADAKENAKITTKVLEGEKGACRDICCLNAGAAIYISGKANSFSEGIKMAENSIDSGKAKAKLDELIKFTNS